MGRNSAHISPEDPSGSDIMFATNNQGIVSDLQVDLGEEEFNPADDTYCGINITKTQPDIPTQGNQSSHPSLQNSMESLQQSSSNLDGNTKPKKGSFVSASISKVGHKGPVPVPIRKHFLVRRHKKFAENSIGLQKVMGPLPLSSLTPKEPRPPKKGDFGQGSSRLPQPDDPLPPAIDDYRQHRKRQTSRKLQSMTKTSQDSSFYYHISSEDQR